jgi:hypothetical protein
MTPAEQLEFAELAGAWPSLRRAFRKRVVGIVMRLTVASKDSQVKLTQLSPVWIVDGGRAVGLRFNCPHCRERLLSVWFANPADGGPPSSLAPANRWTRSGAGFDTLTLTPSIDASSTGHWHGLIRDGLIEDCR